MIILIKRIFASSLERVRGALTFLHLVILRSLHKERSIPLDYWLKIDSIMKTVFGSPDALLPLYGSLSEAPRIIDGGANIGLSVIYFKQLFPRSRTTAFEPDAKILAYRA